MKRNILRMAIFVFLLVTVISLSACSSSDDVSETSSKTNNGFVVVSTQDITFGYSLKSKYLTIMYDPDTLVMYGVTFGDVATCNPSQLTPLYNADGTLKTYTPDTEKD